MAPNRERLRLLLVALVVAVLLVPFWLGAGPHREEITPPSSFVPWPPFVLVWNVGDSGADVATLSPLSSRFGSRPCAAVGVSECLVQLAWDGFSRWSLTASPDAVFDADDPRQFTVGPTHYVIEGGVVIGVWSTDRLPPLHVCHRLLRAHWAGAGVAALQGDGDPVLFASQPMVALEDAEDSTAQCLGPWGIPVRYAAATQEWTPLSLELRSPTDAEIGADLVRGETQHAVPEACLPTDRAPQHWLELAAGGAGYPSTAAGPGVILDVPDVSGLRPVFAWVTASGESTLPDGMRRRLLEPGLVAEELLLPAPVISVPAGELRVWIEFQGPAQWTNPEREIFVLEQVARRLAHAAADDPYDGVAPSSCP